MKINLIVAMTQDRVIGVESRLPWRISEDLKRFKKLTMGHPIIMGRKTFESIGRPLPGRRNVVVTRNRSYQATGVEMATSLEEALNHCESAAEIFVIGGAELYRAALPRADQIYLTLVHKKFGGDTHFPPCDLKAEFETLEESEHTCEKDPSLRFSFLTLARRAKSPATG